MTFPPSVAACAATKRSSREATDRLPRRRHSRDAAAAPGVHGRRPPPRSAHVRRWPHISGQHGAGRRRFHLTPAQSAAVARPERFDPDRFLGRKSALTNISRSAAAVGAASDELLAYQMRVVLAEIFGTASLGRARLCRPQASARPDLHAAQGLAVVLTRR